MNRTRDSTAFGFALELRTCCFLFFSVGIIQRSRGGMLDDPGLGWHLRNIDAMWAQGGWLMFDPFSNPAADWPWRTNQWLGDVLLRISWWWGGLEGIAVLTTLVLAFTFRCLYQMLIRDEVPWPAAVFWTFLGGLGTSLSWVARPNVFSILFLMLTAWVCDRYHRGKCSKKNTWWLLPMFAIWANTHGGFVAGLVVVAATLLIEMALMLGIPHAKSVLGARNRAIHLGMLLGGSFLCTLLNPYGWSLYTWIFRLLGNEFFMNLNREWHSPDFHGRGAMRFELFIIVLPLLLALSKRRPSLVALGISILWLHFALNGQRYVALWVVVTVPLVARLCVDVPWLRKMAGQIKPSPEVARLLVTKPGPVGWVAPLIISAGLFGWARWTDGYSHHDDKRIPVAAINELLEHCDGEVVFHHYNWGGWVTWHGWPKVLNWIDDRNDVHGREHVEQYFSIMGAQPGWHDKLEKHDVSFVCVPPTTPLASRLADRPDWRELYRDEFAVVYESLRLSVPPGNIAKRAD